MTRTLRARRQHINVGTPSNHSWVHTRKTSSETFTHHRSSCATSLLQQFRSPNNLYFAPTKQYRRLHTETIQTTATPKPPSRSKRILDSAEHLDPQDPWYGIVQNEYEQVIQNLAKVKCVVSVDDSNLKEARRCCKDDVQVWRDE